ncbi:sporulation protein [uncultured Cocleimonas sp.]|uniref:sporulation protein n=1 Tax=uncultured Cocleimonas sp. TaxID=1051587 RepID=UPI0026275EAF|nr:sporulation protein [uncultured Cocleimonas sp.]
MTIITYIALAAVLGFILFIVALSVYRRSLAKVDIVIESNTDLSGGVIKGYVEINSKVLLTCERISVALRCLDSADRGGSNPYCEIYRDEQQLSGPVILSAKSTKRFLFSLNIPAKINSIGLSVNAPEAFNKSMEFTKKIALRRRASNIRWDIVTDIKTTKMDLFKSRRIDIDLLP